MVESDRNQIDTAIHSPNYYFTHKCITFGKTDNYSQTLIGLLINTNGGSSNGKYLFVQNEQDVWAICRRTLKPDVHVDIFEAFIELLSDELGFRGIMKDSSQLNFNILGYVFDFIKQEFDQVRMEDQKLKGRNTKGKAYHLIAVEYKGSDELPFDKRLEKDRIKDYKWVSYNEGLQLLEANRELLKHNNKISKVSVEFHISSYKRIVALASELQKMRHDQLSLI